ncbi:inosine triphosphate pyrophosphatase-like protein [Melanogaster broomeanus]|nr:inosine triphosphate pyrophosphatase-like protein [Melanogaster broomeanus]
MSARRLTFVTGNANKLMETKYILSQGIPIEIDSQDLDSKLAASYNFPELQGSTQEIAIAKCRRAAELLGRACITEDTALCYEAFGGLPGPYIKYFMKNLGHEGLNNLLVGFPTTDAYALCTFAYSAGPGTEPILFEGRTDGTIVPARGPPMFGWDPVFQPKGFDKTYAEMTKEEKNVISHRYRALDKLRAFLATLPTEPADA